MKILSGNLKAVCRLSVKYIVALVALFWGYYAIAQQNTLKPLKKYYSNQEPGTCLRIFEDPSDSIHQILLIRHGEPDLNKKGWRRRPAAMEYVKAYDSVGVIPFNEELHCLEGIKTDKVYHSSLHRARHTAQLLFKNKLQLIEDQRFREFERKVMGFINMKLPLGFWLGASRVLWMMGLNDKQIESFRAARSRARENAAFLARQAQDSGQAILVAHGFHNKYVMKYLKKDGWKLVNKGGNGYLAINVLAKIKSPDN
ncbi:histidine phosphatase family protein [Fulvivirgaceae bacterium BMA12]|uniref:Histidine phosphatase family protein n=1 Tax=Agaribacillus aureus TaxID=3051825 RepID=A0ABT8L966_9BACT|nr:histidine phosphatase family protein [Fulvivirgaceae bacterium BMA12]